MLSSFVHKVFLPSLLLLSLLACRQKAQPASKTIRLEGKTMGTAYHVSYIDSLHRNFQPQLDSILHVFNSELSTYDSTSLLWRFNADTVLVLPEGRGAHLERVLELCRQVHRSSNAWFDPTVKPLVHYWGFGYQEKRPIERVDSAAVDSLRGLLGLDKIALRQGADGKRSLHKPDRRISLDVNAIAPGDAADLLGHFLESQGIRHYLVEIGGELAARGRTEQGFPWRIGINTPKDHADVDEFQAVVQLDNRGLATSGNYRSFYEKDGRRYSHTVNPKTGYTEQSRLMSATIIAPKSSLADAYATACMAMGLDSAWAWVQRLPDVDAYFIYVQGDSLAERYTPGMPFVR